MPAALPPMILRYACASDAGRLRENNEDAVLLDPALALAVVADGMGGYNAGEVAARLCCEAVHAALQAQPDEALANPRQRLLEAVRSANRAVFERALLQPSLRGMATTVVAVLLAGPQGVVAHVGDSRLYRLRQGRLDRLTRDHSLVQEHIDAGLLEPEAARASGYRNLVTRALGIAPVVDVEVGTFDLTPGDTLLLCTDGLTDLLTEGEIARLLCHGGPLDSAAARLVQAANAAGGRDNVSVALVHCGAAAATPHADSAPRRCGA
ncbi:MAG: Stp1/IreP family PP2C-type Ser/Thr phosphatase [Tepidimonas sp.]|nr:Stp1/IreP family PP2C-type Ser/Thr phosphatase [Tepidimonas sp.]